MNGKEDIPSISPTEDETFKRLRRIPFAILVDRLKVFWIDQEVINILADDNGWDDWGGNIDSGGWTRSEFTEECRKQCAAGNYTKEQYLNKTGPT